MDPRRRIVTDAAIAVEEDTIVALGKLGDIPPRFAQAEKVIAGRSRVALPGFIDAHAHSPQAMLRGVADDLPWRPYLEKYIWPLQGSYDADDATTSLQLCVLEMLRGG